MPMFFVGAVVAVALVAALYRRPQRGLLLVAALTPLQGLLTVIPGGRTVTHWREFVLIVALAAAFTGPARRRRTATAAPRWATLGAGGALGLMVALVAASLAGLIPFEFTYLYLTIPVILWRAPFDARDRDGLVTILMVAGFVTAVLGLVQQVLGADRLAELGYRWDEHLHTHRGFLHSFSTFATPREFGLFIMLSLVVGCAVAFADPRRRRNRLFLCATPILLLGLGMTIMPACYIGLTVGLLWLAVHRFRALFVVFGGLAVVTPIALLLLPSSVLAPVFSSVGLGARGPSQPTSSLWVRPFGQNTAVDTLAQLDAGSYRPESYYTKLAVDFGLIGVWLFVLVLVVAAASTLYASRRLRGQDAAFALGVSATVVACVVATTMATYPEIISLEVYFWMLVGAVGCAMMQRTPAPRIEEPDPAPCRRLTQVG
ncbi:O-antigen ligase domain-containing protein [Rhodococcus sp. Z13]|uniref:O-antigen ligase domain-containing protein n=1 Tax=Rhodococcus sacchari TaxID=2962047 RepID=A0ACD4DEQ3_9NOCA|nr:O-antigen ligase domain-containing protein [Rhodococcus sp. Z13]UYP18504.1 O-antigen ligase domain-containing protein [Rhodococcus sp. Z13]